MEGLKNCWKVISTNHIITTVLFQCLLHILSNTDVVHNQAILLGFVLTVNTADCLYESMFLQRLVVVKYTQARGIKSSNPHIDHNSDAEIRLVILEEFCEVFTVILIAQCIVHLLLVITLTSGNKVDEWNSLQLFEFLGRQSLFIHSLARFYPFRAILRNEFIESVCYLSIRAYNHCFLYQLRLFLTKSVVVVNDIHSQLILSFGISQYDIER